MSLATSCDITRHHAIGSGSGSGAGGVRRHSSEGVAEEGGGGGSGSGRQAGVGSGSGRRVGIGSGRGSPYTSLASFFSTKRVFASCIRVDSWPGPLLKYKCAGRLNWVTSSSSFQELLHFNCHCQTSISLLPSKIGFFCWAVTVDLSGCPYGSNPSKYSSTEPGARSTG